jgi:hypothetical protein
MAKVIALVMVCMARAISALVCMALAFIAATMLVSSVVVETLDLFDDAEAKEIKKTKSKKKDRAEH